MARAAFRENVVVVTGASGGIGREMALQLAGQGAWLALAARTEERLEAVAKECRGRGGRALVVPTDVADERQCESLVARTVAEYGRLDTLVNNAGYRMHARFDTIEGPSVIENIVKVDFFGAVYCTYHALPHLKQAQGRIVVMSSLAGRQGVPYNTGYAAAKHALTGFFDSLRIELRRDGVSVTVMYPGFVDTRMRVDAVGTDGRPAGQDWPENARLTPVDTCVRVTLRAAARRKREVVMPPQGKVMWPISVPGQIAKALVPGLLDRIAERKIEQGY